MNDLSRLEGNLQRLTPAPSGLDRDSLFHAAGRIQGERKLTLWKGTSATFAVLALGLAAGVIFRPAQIRERVVTVAVAVPVPVATQPAPTSVQPESLASKDSIPSFERQPRLGASSLSYQEMRSRTLRFGPEAILNTPPQPINATVPPSRTVEDDLNLPRGTLPEWKSMQPVQ
jgi:hypothetical protein